MVDGMEATDHEAQTKFQHTMKWITTMGRITGGKFFLYCLPSAFLGVALKSDVVKGPWEGVVAILYLISLPVAILAAIRRSHDLGRSGWFALICFIPFAGFYLILKRGEPGANKYGPSPI